MKLALLALLCAEIVPAQQLPAALVWLPPENFRRWNDVDAFLRARGNARLTIGVTPAMATPSAKTALAPWLEKGRIELAARVGGDPVLTMAAGHPAAPRPRDALERAVEARERLQRRLGLSPAGFIPGAGAVDAGTAAALRASGAGWVLTGPYAAPDASWAAAEKTVFVPSSAARLYDESVSTASVFLAAAADLPLQDLTTVGDLVRAKSEPSIELSAIAAWPAWDLEAARLPPADAGAKAAWDAYGAAALALDRYQNSGSADLGTLDSAVELLRRAQAARHYRPSGSPDPPPELRAALLAVYKRLKLPAPEALYGSETAAAAPMEKPTGIKALSGPSWLEFRAPLQTIALAPLASGATASALVDGGRDADPWRIRSLRAEWDDAAVRLTLRVSSASNAEPRPIYDIYADFNHVLGAGRLPLLEGRGAVVAARDAWELALSIVGDEARLYRARGGGEPEETAAFRAEWSAERGEAVVLVPRPHMRGNPARWGWAAVALAEDPARPGRRPAAPLVGSDGTILLGALAPSGLQKAILSRANPRVPAARLEP
ncbi:MAG: hypothetical protein HY403_02705 [Elusimicrobia bacterium]|nr:hypothetical protein [Elusimicrobiota bacterium]